MNNRLGNVLLILLCIAGAYFLVRTGSQEAVSGPKEHISADVYAELLRKKADAARRFARTNGYNTEFALLADMNIPSGRNRIFLYQFENDSILVKGLVAHGRCNERWLEGRKYANEQGCGCSSLGRYRIGKSYRGKFGLAYKLHGLDSSNNNAFKRFVVLHAHECVAGQETYPDPICQSDGCPTVAPQVLVQLGKIIDHSPRPVLFIIFDDTAE